MKINEIEHLQKKIELTAELFYKQKNQEGYQSLVEVIDGLLAITSELKEIEENEQIIMLRDKLTEILKDITDAMLQKDTILIADMIKYEIMEVLEHVADLEQ